MITTDTLPTNNQVEASSDSHGDSKGNKVGAFQTPRFSIMQYKKPILFLFLSTVLIIISSLFIFIKQKQNSGIKLQATPTSQTHSSSQVISDKIPSTYTWKSFKDETLGFEFRYPEKLDLLREGNKVILKHTISYKNHGKCEMIGDETEYDRLDDFSVTIEIFDEYQYSPYSYIDGIYEAGILKGEWRYIGAEGCGIEEYIFALPDGRCLKVTKDMVQAMSSVIAEEKRQEVLSVPGAISEEESNEIFRQILSRFTLLLKNEITDTSSFYKDNRLYVQKEINECNVKFIDNCTDGKMVSVFITLPIDTKVSFKNGKYVIKLDQGTFLVDYNSVPFPGGWMGSLQKTEKSIVEISARNGLKFTAEKNAEGYSFISGQGFTIEKDIPQSYLTQEDINEWARILNSLSIGEPILD